MKGREKQFATQQHRLSLTCKLQADARLLNYDFYERACEIVCCTTTTATQQRLPHKHLCTTTTSAIADGIWLPREPQTRLLHAHCPRHDSRGLG